MYLEMLTEIMNEASKEITSPEWLLSEKITKATLNECNPNYHGKTIDLRIMIAKKHISIEKTRVVKVFCIGLKPLAPIYQIFIHKNIETHLN